MVTSNVHDICCEGKVITNTVHDICCGGKVVASTVHALCHGWNCRYGATFITDYLGLFMLLLADDFIMFV